MASWWTFFLLGRLGILVDRARGEKAQTLVELLLGVRWDYAVEFACSELVVWVWRHMTLFGSNPKATP